MDGKTNMEMATAPFTISKMNRDCIEAPLQVRPLIAILVCAMSRALIFQRRHFILYAEADESIHCVVTQRLDMGTSQLTGGVE